MPKEDDRRTKFDPQKARELARIEAERREWARAADAAANKNGWDAKLPKAVRDQKSPFDLYRIVS